MSDTLEFNLNLSHDKLPKGIYLWEITKTSLYVKEETGWQAIVATINVAQGRFEGYQGRIFVAIPDPTSKGYMMQVAYIKSLLSAIAREELESDDENPFVLRAEKDVEGQYSFPDIEGETFWAHADTNAKGYLEIKAGDFLMGEPVVKDDDDF